MADGTESTSSSSSRRKLFSRSRTLTFAPRTVCQYHTKCYRRNPDHLKEQAHPADPDYLDSCRYCGVKPELVSIRKLFDWCDVDHSGKATRQEMQQIWDQVQKLGQDVGPLTDDLWKQLDDDGNGFVNFGEFAEFTTKMKVELPLGLDDLLGSNEETTVRCGVIGCKCKKFVSRRRQCKYGEQCYNTSDDHREKFSHPDDNDWKTAGKPDSPGDVNMCTCGHKRTLHSSAGISTASAGYPPYWHFPSRQEEFNCFVRIDDPSVPTALDRWQALFDTTYSDVTTRDRFKSCKTWQVPRSFTAKEVRRNENSKLWHKYTIQRATLKQERERLQMLRERGEDVPEFVEFTTKVNENWDTSHLDRDINEWYLFHGTSATAARNICRHDFQMRLAGSNTGTLYGRGTYLAESITKADEYSKEEDGQFTVLLCRVLGGMVRYCDEKEPNPDELTQDCAAGCYDSILGDREKLSGTYKEFVIFDSQNVYPEYLISYKRGEYFKSPSHP